MGKGASGRGRWRGGNGKGETGKGAKGGRGGGEKKGQKLSQMDMMKCVGLMRLESFLTLFTRATLGTPASVRFKCHNCFSLSSTSIKCTIEYRLPSIYHHSGPSHLSDHIYTGSIPISQPHPDTLNI